MASTRTEGRGDRRAALAGSGLLLAMVATLWPTSVEAARVSREPSSRPPSAARIGDPRTTLELDASYELRTQLLYRAASLDVDETVRITNRSPRPIDALHLSVLARAYGEFRLHSVRVDGESTRVRWPDRADMLVLLSSPLQPDGQTTLTITFTDHPKRDATDSLRSRLSKAEGLMRVADWYPILSSGHGLRNPGDSQVSAAASSITLDVTTDQPLTVAAPGKLVEQHGRRRVYRIEDARNYGFVVAPHLRTLTTTTHDGIRVRVYAPPGVGREAARRALREARRALQTYADAYGPYPWPELILAPTPGRGFATEWPSIVFLAPDTYGSAEVVHHEVAHQWFYALMGNDQLREPWIDEAFAVFSERHFFGSRDWSFCSGKKVDSAVDAFPNTYARWGCGGYVETVYQKGAAMIDGVRARMGDRTFFRTMRGFMAQHRFEIVSGDQIVRAWLPESRNPTALRRWLGRFLGRPSMAAPRG